MNPKCVNPILRLCFLKTILVSIIVLPCPRWHSVKESACNAGDLGLIPGVGRCPGEGNGTPLWYSCLGNPMYRGACGLQYMGSQESQAQLSKSATQDSRPSNRPGT